MTKARPNLRGLYPACATAVDADGHLDRAAMSAHVGYIIDHGASGVVPLGGTGEATALLPQDRVAAVETTVDVVAGRGHVIAGVLSPGLGDTIAAARDYLAAGADAIMLIVPYYARNTPQGVIDYFRRVRDAADIPIVLYDNPFKTHFVLPPSVVGTLSADDTIIGMKATNTDLYHFDQIVQCVTPEFAMLSGQDGLFTQQVMMGARGGVLTTAGLAPAYWNQIQKHAEAGEFTQAMAMQRKFYPLMDALFVGDFPSPLRAALEMVGLPCGPALTPLTDSSPEVRRDVLAILNRLYDEGCLPVQPQA